MEPLTAHLDLVTIKCIYKVTAPVFIFSYMLYVDLAFKQFQTMNGFQNYSNLRKLLLNKIHYTMQTEAWAFAIVAYNMYAVACI